MMLYSVLLVLVGHKISFWRNDRKSEASNCSHCIVTLHFADVVLP